MYKKLVSLDNLAFAFDNKYDKNAKNIVDHMLSYWGVQTFVPSANSDSSNTDGNGFWYTGNVIKGSDGVLYTCVDDTPTAAVWIS